MRTAASPAGRFRSDDPWGAFADDQLGLMDHLGIQQFFYMGYCIGGRFGLKLIERAPDRVVAAVLCQPVGHRPENPDVMYNSGRDVWAPELRARRPEITMESIEAYLHNLYRVRPDFVYSVSRDFVRSCQTPMLVMPDDTPAHPYQTSVDIAALAPKAESTVFPWREPKDLLEKTIDQVRGSSASISRRKLPARGGDRGNVCNLDPAPVRQDRRDHRGGERDRTRDRRALRRRGRVLAAERP